MALAYPSLVRQACQNGGGSRSDDARAERYVDELMESNPYYAKYHDKIAALRASDPRKFEAAMKNRTGGTPATATATSPVFPQLRTAGTPAAAFSRAAVDDQPSEGGARAPRDPPSRRPLGTVMRMDMIADKSADEIAGLWNAHHSDKGGVYCVLPASAYAAMHDRARSRATFVYPLPRGQGIEFFVGQWLGDACHFAPLVAYHAHGESAPVCVSLAYYTELVDSKGIVLMSGEVDTAVLQLHLAQLLVHQLHAFYGSEDNYRLVESMHSSPHEFRHEDVVEACKKWSLL